MATKSSSLEKKPSFSEKLRAKYPNMKLAYLYILPAFIIMAFISFYPLFYQLWMSFTDFALKDLRTLTPNFVWVENFVNILVKGLPVPNFQFGRILVFNLIWTVVNVFFHVTLGILIALALNIKELPGKKIYRSLFVIPWALPSLISGMVWANMWQVEYGAINNLLKAFGLNGSINWLENVQPVINLPQIGLVLPLSFFAVVIANIWLGWPFMMVIATGALQSIPTEMYEAAEMDGANRYQKLWNITLPMIRPAMIPAIMIGIMMTFNQFNIIYFVTGGGPIGLTEILVTQGYKLVNPQGWYGVASAFNVIVFIILGIITLATNRVSKATEAYSA